MKLDRARFFAAWRPALGAIRDPAAVRAVEDVLRFAEFDEGFADARCLAYVFATIHHETARTWRPIEEFGKGHGRDYGEAVLLARGRRVAFYGRGYVQLTWLENYARASLALGINLVSNPDLALDPENAWQITSRGMRFGWFTGKRLSDYIGDVADYRGARRIINGQDKAAEIAFYAERFEAAIRAARGTA